MKRSTKRIIIMEIIISLIITINAFAPFLFDNYKYLIFLLLFGVAGHFVIGLDLSKSPNEVPVFKRTLFFLLIYFLLIYILGLYIGFARTVYSWSFTNVVKNILPTMTVILVCEILRYQFIKKSDGNRVAVLLSILIFTLLDTSIGYYNYNLSLKSDIYEFVGIIFLGSLSKNILMSVFDVKGDFYNAAAYRFIMELYVFIIPIIPDLSPYIRSVFLIVFPAVLSVSIFNFKEKKLEKPKHRKRNNVIFAVVVITLLLLVGLNSGIFKYQSIVIGSNSMIPFMKKGDVVIMERLKSTEKKNIKKGDIILFKHDKQIISHRVYRKVMRDNHKYYITKGDNNAQVDAGATIEDDVMGVVKFRIKNIGIPSIWLNELFD